MITWCVRVCAQYVLLSTYFIWALFKDSGCDAILSNILLPFFG
eukprot:COSAG05_NODE_12921_length_449_cov_0.605714_1_plen_42_part_10